MAGVDFEKAVRRLRDELSSSIGGERYKRVSPALRAQVVAVARSAHEGGWSWSAIGESLGIASKKVQRWCTEDVGVPAWMPVEIVEATHESTTARLSVVLPNGVRVEGLCVADAAALLRALA